MLLSLDFVLTISEKRLYNPLTSILEVNGKRKRVSYNRL